MTISYGLTEDGFVIKPLDVIRSEIEQRFREAFGSALPLGDATIEGQIIGIFAERERLLWERMEQVYSSRDRDKASAAALRALCLLTGTRSPPATRSAVFLTATGDPTTVISEGDQAKVPDTDRVFEVREGGTIALATAWAPTTAYVVGDFVTNVSNIYVCTTAGISAGSGGPDATDPTIDEIDGTAHWRFTGTGTGFLDNILASATTTGPLEAPALTITEIVTAVAGWDNVTNRADANPGADEFTDAEMRIQAEVDLAKAGKGSVPAIVAGIFEVTGVEAVTVFYNNTDLEDDDGVPPHSVEIMVQGGDDQPIWDAVFENVAAGIRTVGTEAGTVSDDEGVEHDVSFSRPVEEPIYVVANILVDPDLYPEDGDDQVIAAIVEFGNALKAGRDVVSSSLSASVFNVDGILDVQDLFIGLAPAPATETTIPIAARQKALYDTTRVTVNATEGVP